MAEVMQAQASFTFDRDGAPVFIKKDSLWAGDDAVVKAYPSHFAEPTVNRSPERTRRARRPGAVETATAGPGERRELSGPPKGAAKMKAETPPGEV